MDRQIATLTFACLLTTVFASCQRHDDTSSWVTHVLDSNPASGSDGVKMADVNGDGLPDLVTGFEEDGISRIYINPGYARIKKQHWEYVELPSPDVEDALLIDLDNNGIIDLVTASEGTTNQITFHWAPDNPKDYLDAAKWTSQTVPATDGLAAWMFVVPTNMDHNNGLDLIVGSKRKKGDTGDDKAIVGWLKSPENPRDIAQWTFHPLSKAGWIMSIVVEDMNGDGHPDILISDRKNSTQTGVRWLENPGGVSSPDFYSQWLSHLISTDIQEPMFLALQDLDGDGLSDIIVPDLYKGLAFLRQTSEQKWEKYEVPYPEWAAPRGKSVAIGDLYLNDRPDIVLSFEEEGEVAGIPFEEYKKNGKYSVIGGKYDGDPFTGKWTFHKISNRRGRKFDLVNLIDMDADGDLDVLTNDENEEEIGMGIIWYENPAIE